VTRLQRLSLCLCLALGLVAVASSNEASARRGCTREFAPVCGLDQKGVRATQPNPCVARQANIRVLHGGECFGPICTMIYDPVCAKDSKGVRRTFPSLCEASNANAALMHRGPC